MVIINFIFCYYFVIDACQFQQIATLIKDDALVITIFIVLQNQVHIVGFLSAIMHEQSNIRIYDVYWNIVSTE